MPQCYSVLQYGSTKINIQSEIFFNVTHTIYNGTTEEYNCIFWHSSLCGPNCLAINILGLIDHCVTPDLNQSNYVDFRLSVP